MKHLTDGEIQTYLHGLPDKARIHIEHHLQECAECKNQLHFYQQLGPAVISALADDSHDGFENAVMERLRDIQRFRRVADLGVAAAAFVTVGVASLIVFMIPPLRGIIADYLVEIWRIGGRMVADLTEPTTGDTLMVAAIVFALLALVDWQAAKILGLTASANGKGHGSGIE